MESEIFSQNRPELTKLLQFDTHTEFQEIQKRRIPETKFEFLEQSSNLGYSDNRRRASLDWHYSIRNYIFQGKTRQALLLYTRIRGFGSHVVGAIPSVLKACASLAMLSLGKALHAESIKTGVEFDVTVGTSLVDMYGKCWDISSSRKVFDIMPERDIRTWNALIGGYMRNGDTESATSLFEDMQMRTSVTWNQIIDGFAKRGNMAMAKQLFDKMPGELKTVVTWTVMVDGYARFGEMEAANEIFKAMPKRNFYVWSSLISGYFKKGEVDEATAIFDQMKLRNLVIWNSLIAGYVQNGLCKTALAAFQRMQFEGFQADEFTVVSLLSACAREGLLDTGKEIHEMIIQLKLHLNRYVLNGLVDMYAKCGDLNNAKLIFENTSLKNTATWNALILGYAIHGQCRKAMEYASKMVFTGEKPDSITFLAVLSACVHGGFVEEGLETFSKMEKYGLTASVQHYGCVVDLLGRAGRLEEAYNLVKGMPIEPNEKVLGALLGACRIHSDIDMAELVLKEIEKLKCRSNSSDPKHYILLSSIYAASEKWEKAEGMRVALTNVGSQKTPGHSAVILESDENGLIRSS